MQRFTLLAVVPAFGLILACCGGGAAQSRSAHAATDTAVCRSYNTLASYVRVHRGAVSPLDKSDIRQVAASASASTNSELRRYGQMLSRIDRDFLPNAGLGLPAGLQPLLLNGLHGIATVCISRGLTSA